MNERIKELAKQADIWCDQNYPNNEFYDIRWEEKFAELIVRECNQAVSEVPCYYEDYRSQIEQAVINDCARAVLDYFGVDN